MTRLLLGLVALLCVFIGQQANAAPGWQNRPHVCDMEPGPRLEKCQTWISTVRRPDYREASCCGDADAFIADNFEQGPNGELFAIITGEYNPPEFVPLDGEEPPKTTSMRKGTKILIPREKRNYHPEDAGNTSGHGVVFIRLSDGEVLCYFAPPLT